MIRVRGLAACCLLAALPSSVAATSPIVARVNDGAIHCAALVSVAESPVGRRLARQSADQTEAKSAWLRLLASEQQLAREAESLRLAMQPETAAKLKRTASRLALRALEVGWSATVEVPEAAVLDHYHQHREDFRTPPRLVSRFILIKIAQDTSEVQIAEAHRQLLEIRQLALSGTSFGALAERYSEAENAGRGGTVAASPRGALPAVYENVAWQQAEGEVSLPVRLRDGMALILTDKIFPAKDRSLAQASRSIAERLLTAAIDGQRQQAVAAAHELWPVTIDDGRGITIGGQALSLDELGLGHRPPRLADRIRRAVDQLLLQRWADRQVAQRADVAAQIERSRQRVLATARIQQLVAERLPEVPLALLWQRYERLRSALKRPERRRFEALIVRGREGALRAAHELATDLAAAWRRTETGSMETFIGHSIERWGPLDRQALANSLSPLVAERAFSLGKGEVGEPQRFERYDAKRLKFVADGYAVLKVEGIEPALEPTFDQARPRLAADLSKDAAKRIEQGLRQTLTDQLAIEIDAAALAACPLPGRS